MPGGEVVDHADPESFTQQCLHQMGADKPGPAGNQCELGCRHGSFLLSIRTQAGTILALGAITSFMALRVSTISGACSAIQFQS